MKSRCDRSWEIDAFRERRLGPKDARSFERHLRACAPCREQLEGDERLQRLARELPDEEPGELALRRVRARVLRDVATGQASPQPSRWAPRVALMGLLAVAGLGVWAWMPWSTPADAVVAAATPPPEAPSESYAGTVVASADTRWSQERALGVERVTLQEGSLHVHVRPQTAAERFLVVLPDGDIEVRGTTFDVRVEHGATTSVHVDEGIVELRIAALAAMRLVAGDTWPPDEPPPPSARTIAPALVRAPSPARSTAPAPMPSAAEPYSDAMRLLREGHDGEAAAAFHAFAQSQPQAPQAEDASFLEAVALARAGRGDAAALAAEHHLASFPASFHRKEASILLARAAVQRGDCAKARSVLAPWQGDPDVVAALRACR